MSTTAIAVPLTGAVIKPRLLRIKEAAAYLGLSAHTLREMAHLGEVKFIQRRDGGVMLFDVGDLDLWIERSKQ
jgi:excisionase family DNA binding protein